MTPGPAIETTEPWRWDRYNRTAQGRYLFAREWDFLRRVLREHPAPRRVVDVGAGSGRFAVRLHRVEGYRWLPFRRESHIPLVRVAAWAERVLRLDALPALSPKILVAATRRG